ncbi:MAG TPA: DinB family protein [Thermoanaerobaculia bacterium]|nr:DinB family protein [Thermoanaerobaculia bacterium]
MTLKETTIDHLRRAFFGPSTHGPALHELIDDLTEAQAQAKPIDCAHSIAELLAHVTSWIDAIARRLEGEIFRTSEVDNFPDVNTLTFDDVRSRFTRAHDRLLAAVERIDDLLQPVSGRDYNVLQSLDFVVDHSLYHAGQIALLKKVSTSA